MRSSQLLGEFRKMLEFRKSGATTGYYDGIKFRNLMILFDIYLLFWLMTYPD